jgi:hypothetical protein
MKQLVIDRSKWRNGGNEYDKHYGDTQLLNEQGFMCCLGFYCLQIGGKTPYEIIGIPQPEDVDLHDGLGYLTNDLGRNTCFTDDAIKINDNECIDNDMREHQIKEHFKMIDVEVTFMGDYPLKHLIPKI